jgi:hypothetical protein
VRRRRPKLPPEWQAYTGRRKSRFRLTRQDKRLGAGAFALVFVGVFVGSGGEFPGWSDAIAALPKPAYRNCAAARAAGAAPVYRGQSGYGEHLDADSDGIGCEGRY